MSANFTRQQIEWTRQVRDDLRLPDRAIRVADAIAFDYMNEVKGEAWPGEALLCKRVGKSEKTVSGAVDLLVERGHLIKISGGGRGKSNRYRWIIKSENSGKNAGVSEQVSEQNTGKSAGVSGGETPAFSKEFTDAKPRQKRKVNSGSFGAKTPAKMPEEPLEKNRSKGAPRSRAAAPASDTDASVIVDDVIEDDVPTSSSEPAAKREALAGEPPRPAPADLAADDDDDGWMFDGATSSDDVLAAIGAAHAEFDPAPSLNAAQYASEWTLAIVSRAKDPGYVIDGAATVLDEALSFGADLASTWWRDHIAAMEAYAEFTGQDAEAIREGVQFYTKRVRNLRRARRYANA